MHANAMFFLYGVNEDNLRLWRTYIEDFLCAQTPKIGEEGVTVQIDEMHWSSGNIRKRMPPQDRRSAAISRAPPALPTPEAAAAPPAPEAAAQETHLDLGGGHECVKGWRANITIVYRRTTKQAPEDIPDLDVLRD